MSLLFSNEILDSVKKELNSATSSVQIITAYCKQSSLSHLNGCINNSVVDKKLLVRFRMDDVLKGSTDFSILEYGIQAGWEVYVRFDLHAKTYIVDNKRGLVGSANATNSGYISEYILTGNKNSSWSVTNPQNSYTKRNWNMYVNSDQGATSAEVLTKAKLDSWYSKYVTSGANTFTQSTFQMIYNSPTNKYQTLVDNHSYYWLSVAVNATRVYYVSPYNRDVGSIYTYGYGVRVLVSLPSNIQISGGGNGKRTVTLDGMTYNGGTYTTASDQEYNVWNLGPAQSGQGSEGRSRRHFFCS